MSYLSHVVTTKGFVHSLERSVQILKRFTLGRRRFLQMIAFLQNDMNTDAKITFCVTACLLAENSFLFRRLQEMGHDVAGHGYIHTNMKNKSKREQIDIIRKCSRVFDEFRMPISGFRCPYLSYNSDTLEVLQKGGFAWTSNNMVLWRNGINGRNGNHDRKLRKINNLYTLEYAETNRVLPRFRDKCVDIPITGPDDEMLLERFRVKEKEKIVALWTDILRQTHERGELFHLLFHPERFHHIKGCLKDLVAGAKRLGGPIWFASLKEITDWWKIRRNIRWEHEQMHDGTWRTWVSAPSGVTILAKRDPGANGNRPLFFGEYARLEPVASNNGSRLFPYMEGRKGSIGISKRCHGDVETFLREEGFLAEYANNPQEHPVFIDGYTTFSKKDEQRLLRDVEASGPVLRMWRWPKGARSAFTISADVDSVTLMDFVRRAIRF